MSQLRRVEKRSLGRSHGAGSSSMADLQSILVEARNTRKQLGFRTIGVGCPLQ